MEAPGIDSRERRKGWTMIRIMKRWAGATTLLSGITIAAAAHGQDVQGDLWRYQRDQGQAARDYARLQYDAATGDIRAAQRDIRNLQRDQQDLSVDQRNLRDDARFLQGPLPRPQCRPPAPSPYAGSPYAGSPYGGGYVPAVPRVSVSVVFPW